MNMNDNKVESTGFMQMGKTYGIIFNEANYEDEVELQLGDYEIEIRDGKTYAVRKKPKYPTTYEECCKIMQVARPTIWFDYDDVSSISKEGDEYESRLENTLCTFRKLFICRDAYWKIAGEEMGLDKPWEPDWVNLSTNHEFIKINKSCFTYSSRVLVFPTTEMRDAFKNNFGPDIEICKEFL